MKSSSKDDKKSWLFVERDTNNKLSVVQSFREEQENYFSELNIMLVRSWGLGFSIVLFVGRLVGRLTIKEGVQPWTFLAHIYFNATEFHSIENLQKTPKANLQISLFIKFSWIPF